MKVFTIQKDGGREKRTEAEASIPWAREVVVVVVVVVAPVGSHQPEPGSTSEFLEREK